MPNTMLSLLAAALVWIAPELFSDLSFDQALAKAQADKKIVMIDFFTTWCGPCKRLDSTTWKDAQVNTWAAEKCIALKIDAEKQVELAQRFKINAYPTIVFVKPDGTEIDRLVGFRDAKTFLEEVAAALAGKDGVARAKEKLAGRENDAMARQSYADELSAKGLYEQALAEYLWCFDHGRESAGYGGVRLSFLLQDLDNLARVHPPTIAAMQARRDAAEARLLAGAESADDVQDVAALNEHLQAPTRTFELYDKLRAQNKLSPTLRSAFLRHVLPKLIEAQRYAEALALVEDPAGYIGQSIETIAVFEKQLRADPETAKQADALLGQRRATLVQQGSLLHEAALGTGKSELAQTIVDRLIAFQGAGSTYALLIESSARAGKLDVAQAIADRAASSLSDEKEKKRVVRVLERVSKPK